MKFFRQSVEAFQLLRVSVASAKNTEERKYPIVLPSKSEFVMSYGDFFTESIIMFMRGLVFMQVIKPCIHSVSTLM